LLQLESFATVVDDVCDAQRPTYASAGPPLALPFVTTLGAVALPLEEDCCAPHAPSATVISAASAYLIDRVMFRRALTLLPSRAAGMAAIATVAANRVPQQLSMD
jgi:hypothetical protein